jgi:hypothetical protein
MSRNAFDDCEREYNLNREMAEIARAERDDMDYRTKAGQEAEILAQVKKCGGFSVFWVTENQKRARAAERLQNRGTIVRLGGAFPWCAYKVQNEYGSHQLL